MNECFIYFLIVLLVTYTSGFENYLDVSTNADNIIILYGNHNTTSTYFNHTVIVSFNHNQTCAVNVTPIQNTVSSSTGIFQSSSSTLSSLSSSSANIISSSKLSSSGASSSQSSSLISSSIIPSITSSSSLNVTEPFPQFQLYTLNYICNVSSAIHYATITTSSYNINYFQTQFNGPINAYVYAIWNVATTATETGTYIIGINNDWAFRLTINGVVYGNSMSQASYSSTQNTMLYSMAVSVSFIAGTTYPIIVEYCTQVCPGCNTLQLITTLPSDAGTHTNSLLSVFQPMTNVSTVPSLTYFTPFNGILSNVTNVTFNNNNPNQNTVQPQIQNAPGNTQTSCPSIPWTPVGGSCDSCPTYSWFTSGTYSFTPTAQCTTAWVQSWGAAGQDGRVDYTGGFCAQQGLPGWDSGGAGGYTSAVIALAPNIPYSIVVGSGGNSFFTVGNSGGGFIGDFQCGIGTASGGGLSGLYLNSQPLLIAGGGGGGGTISKGGSGGGLVGNDSSGLYYGTGGNSITQQNGFNIFYNISHYYPACVGANYGTFLYTGGGGGLYNGGNGGISACDSVNTINTQFLSFWGAGGGSGYMCGQGNTVYGITLNGDNSSIPRSSPHYPGSNVPSQQLLQYTGNDGGIKITCLTIAANRTIVNTTHPTPTQIFGSSFPGGTISNTCPPYSIVPASNSTCNAIPIPVVVNKPVTCPSNRTFYVSQILGNDNNNGLSPSTPWASLTHINTLANAAFFYPGDTIMFCRGDVYMRQYIIFQNSVQGVNTTTCALRFTAYVCNPSTENVLPLMTLSTILPQTSTVGWQSIQWPLFNGSVITVLKYNFSLLDSLTVPLSYLPSLADRQAGGVQNIWVNTFTYAQARHPNAVDLSVWDYDHQYGTTLYEWMHMDPNDLINNPSYNTACYTPPKSRISPGSWCNHIWNDMFGQNTELMTQTLQNTTFFNGVSLFANGAQGYSNIEFTFGNTYQQYLNATGVYDCDAWYNLVVAPYFPSNTPWGNPIFDALPVAGPENNVVTRAYINNFAEGFVECDPARIGNYLPRGVPSSVTNLSWPETNAPFIQYAYNDAFIMSNHFAFLDQPGEYWYNATNDCLYLVPWNAQHSDLLTSTYTTYDVKTQVQQTIYQGASTSFQLAFVMFNNGEPYSIFGMYPGQNLIPNIEIDSFEFVFGGRVIGSYYANMIFHHNIVRGMLNSAESDGYGTYAIVAENIFVNTTGACISIGANYLLVLNNSCANAPAFGAMNTNGPSLELIRGNSIVNPGCIGISMAGGNTNTLINGVIQPTIGEFNWVDGGSQLCAQWASLNSNQGVLRYNEITNIHGGNWVYLHLANPSAFLSQSLGLTTIQGNQIIDNNILINSTGAGIVPFRTQNGFTTISNNLNIDAEFGSQNFDYYYMGNNEFVSTTNVLPDLPDPGSFMYPNQINMGQFGSMTGSQSSYCNGLLDYTDFSSEVLSKYWNGNLGASVVSIDENIPTLQTSKLYTDVDNRPQLYVGKNEDQLQEFNAQMYNWIKSSLDNSQITWGAQNCTYYAQQQLELKRAQNCQARINSEPGVWETIYSFYPNYHSLTGICWPPTGDRVIHP